MFYFLLSMLFIMLKDFTKHNYVLNTQQLKSEFMHLKNHQPATL